MSPPISRVPTTPLAMNKSKQSAPVALVVGMHVPETGNQKLTFSVHSGGAAWNGDPGADCGDPFALCNHSDTILQAACYHVDHGDISDRNGLLRRPSLGAREKYSSQGQRGVPAQILSVATHRSKLALKSRFDSRRRLS